jgi:anti-sigma regulatory factor (Ser/Thr protein kinase)
MTSLAIDIGEATAASGARRRAEALGAQAGFDQTRIGQLAIVVMELATNILKHAQHGEILLAECRSETARGIEVLALDKGRGMRDVEASSVDGHSTSGSLGQGLGAVRRMANAFEVFSQPAKGTVALARLWAGRDYKSAAGAFALGAVNVAKDGERESGDAWVVKVGREAAVVMVADGLGHGVLAAEAAAAAVAAFERDPFRPPRTTLEDVHLALRATRGAAVAIAGIDFESSRVQFAGLGNISGAIVDGTAKRSMVSHNGTAGHTARTLQEFTYPMTKASVMVMHSDGLHAGWNPADYAGLWTRDPALAAGVLYRDFTRRRDDATVVVGRRL